MKFFTYRQNNSGGVFVGPAAVIVEAQSAEEANMLAEFYTPVYFDGCSTGDDCSCCGDRWYPQWPRDKGFEQPGIYESGVLKEERYFDRDILIRYHDGSKITIKGRGDVETDPLSIS